MITHLTRIVLVQIMYDTHEYIISTMSRYYLSTPRRGVNIP